MKLRAYAIDSLNPQASALVDAQTDIKVAIKKGVLKGLPFTIVHKEVKKIIDRATKKIVSEQLKRDARVSLIRFGNVCYTQFKAQLNINPLIIGSVVTIMQAITNKENPNLNGVFKPQTAQERLAVQTLTKSPHLTIKATEKGLPLREFHGTYIKKVEKALHNLAKTKALDPTDFTGRNSLRNLAEMQVRYENHQKDIAELKTKTRLVVCSVHADCSDRCKEWQGGVYSLDGTSGKTEDGRQYQPLEKATDIFYTTKAGRTYKNGLLGFNCRHKLFPYKPGMVIPKVDEKTQRREYEITKTQRAMERAVIAAREEALTAKDVNIAVYRKWKKIAVERYKAYKKFSEKHGRAFYPDRVKIL